MVDQSEKFIFADPLDAVLGSRYPDFRRQNMLPRLVVGSEVTIDASTAAELMRNRDLVARSPLDSSLPQANQQNGGSHLESV